MRRRRQTVRTIAHRPGPHGQLEFAGDDRTDSYGRLLAIVRLGDAQATTWQERMVRSGWADVLVVGGNRTPLLPVLRRDAAYAKAHRLGVWAVCDGHFHDPGIARVEPRVEGPRRDSVMNLRSI